MSATIEDVASALGVSVRGIRLRIDALDDVIKPYLRRGSNNQVIFTGEAVGLLKRLEELRHRDGLSVKAAASILRQSQNEATKEGQANGESALNDPLRELVEHLREEIMHLRKENEWLRRRVEELTARALPPPRHWWWPFRARVRT